MVKLLIDMSESIPNLTSVTEHESLHESILRTHNEDGSFNQAFLDAHGLDAEFAAEEMEYGGKTAPLYQVVLDKECPVGGKMREAVENAQTHPEKGVSPKEAALIKLGNLASFMDKDALKARVDEKLAVVVAQKKT